nr:MAG TPA: hypothetical protein [Caudoviricetes sp.]
MKGFASILKSRLEDAVDTRADLYNGLRDLEDTSLKDLSREIDTLQDLDGDLGNSLENLEKAIEELEKALNKVDVTE